jgi:hypothetical protein
MTILPSTAGFVAKAFGDDGAPVVIVIQFPTTWVQPLGSAGGVVPSKF